MKRVLLAFAVALPLVVMGCGKEEPLPQHQASSTPPPADTGTFTPTGTSATATTVTPTAAPPVTTPAPGAVIASTDGEATGLTLNVTELKRGSGGTVMLKFTIVNGTGENLGFGYEYGDGNVGAGDYNSVGGVHLIDPVGKKKYFVVRDSESKCVCSRGIDAVKPGQSRNLWAKFPAPPPEVQRVTVVVPKFTPMDDVPLS